MIAVMKALTHINGLSLEERKQFLQFIDQIASANLTKDPPKNLKFKLFILA